MKRSYVLLYVLVFLLVAIVGVTIYVSGKNHMAAVETAVKLDSANASLQEQVVVVTNKYGKELSKYDSVLAKKDSTIKVQKNSIFGLIKQVATRLFVTTSSISYVHDTVFVTEKKNFWGRVRTSVATTSSTVDSCNSVMHEEPILLGSQIEPVDSLKH